MKNTSEHKSCSAAGDSSLHHTVTTKHHVDRAKTSEVTIAMCAFVCVRVRIRVYVCGYSGATSSSALHQDNEFAVIHTPELVSAHCWFIINKTQRRLPTAPSMGLL